MAHAWPLYYFWGQEHQWVEIAVLMDPPLFHPNGQCEFIHVRLDLLGYPNDQCHIFCCMEYMYYK